MTTSALLLCAAACLLFAACGSEDGAGPTHAPATSAAPGRPLSAAQVSRFARVALAGISREYPNKPGFVLTGPAAVRGPRATHPAFYGCFDWHSAVHGHWMLVRLLKLHPEWTAEREAVIAALDANLSAENLATEAAWFDAPENRSFERTYGWAWLLRLAQELRTWEHDLGRSWSANLSPLERKIVTLAKAYLPKLTLPIRSGEHRDAAFGLALFLDYARAVGDAELATLCAARAKQWYGEDVDYPVRYEPSGHDFFSAGLNEADLMRRVLPAAEFRRWLDAFLPGLARQDLGPLAVPAQVSDVTDGKLVHLAGLNLTRAWTLRGIAGALAAGDERRAWLEAVAQAHTDAGLGYVFSGHYAGEHWLASFAVYLLTDAGR